jgi:hypothetical protein
MTETDKDRGTQAANERGPTAEPCEVGISSNVLRELPNKADASIVKRIKEHVARKRG